MKAAGVASLAAGEAGGMNYKSDCERGVAVHGSEVYVASVGVDQNNLYDALANCWKRVQARFDDARDGRPPSVGDPSLYSDTCSKKRQ